jgi:hypothetical protein
LWVINEVTSVWQAEGTGPEYQMRYHQVMQHDSCRAFVLCKQSLELAQVVEFV